MLSGKKNHITFHENQLSNSQSQFSILREMDFSFQNFQNSPESLSFREFWELKSIFKVAEVEKHSNQCPQTTWRRDAAQNQLGFLQFV